MVLARNSFAFNCRHDDGLHAAKQSDVLKEAWEVYLEQAGGALFKDLSRYGIRMPKYSDVIVKEKEHVSHQAWWDFL